MDAVLTRHHRPATGPGAPGAWFDTTDTRGTCHVVPAAVPDVLGAYLDATGTWEREPVRLAAEVIGWLWGITAVNLLVGGWSAAVLAAALPCSGFLCTLATLGDRPILLLVLTGSCLATLLASATVTGGLTRATTPQLAVLITAAVVGIGAVLGAALALLIIVVTVTVIVCVFIAVVERSR